MKVDISKKQLNLLYTMIWSPDNLKAGFTGQVTKKTLSVLRKGNTPRSKGNEK